MSPWAIAADPVIDDPGRDADETEAAKPTTARKPGYHTENFRIRPSLSITEKYDSNVFATDTDTLSDWITVISPQIRVDSTWAKHSLQFKAGADAGRYWDYDAENYLDYWASAEGRYNLTADTDLFGGAGISYEHEGRDSPDAGVGGLSPTTYRSVNAHAGVKSTFGDTTYRFGGTYEGLDFNNVPAATGVLFNDDRDRELFGVGVRATHKLNAKTEAFAQALYDVRDYDLSTDQAGFDRDSDGYSAAVGMKHDWGGGSNAEAYVGVLRQDYDDPRFNSVTRPDFAGRLNLRPGPDTKVTARLQRSLNETTVTGSPGYISTALSGKIEHRLSQRLIPHFSVSYEMADYLQSGREDEVYSAEAGVKYFLARNAYIVTGLRHVARDSNDADLLTGSNDFERNSVFLTFVTQGYPLAEPGISDFDTDGEIGIGLLSVSDDSMRFGRYSGLTEEGLEWNADLKVRSHDGQRGYAEIKGLDLGLDSRSLSIDWGSQGSYDAFIHYDQIPHRDFVGRTIFSGVGSTSLTRPAGWVDGDSTADMTQLYSSLSEVEIGTVRKRLGVGTLLHATDDRWTVSLGYETETKDGLEQIAGIIGTSPGNGRSAMLPVPVDYTTNTLKASMGYLRNQTQLDLSYTGSFFYNNLKAVAWENPFDNTGPRGTDGSVSLPPDNQFHQLMLSGGHTLFGTTRLTGVASVGVMLQDDTFLPDTVDPLLTPHALPRDSLEGEVYLYNAMLALSSRPLRGLNLKASYRLQKRDNRTPQDTFTYFVNDSFGGLTSSPDTSTNQPYSYDKRTLQLDAGYRINRVARLSGEVSRDTIERTPSEVDKTTEDQGKLKLRLSPLDNVQVSLKGGIASRTGSDYEPIAGENPLLRKYNISDRDRVSHGIDLSYQPDDRLALSASLDVSDDDYDATRVGLTDARQTSAILDASYRLTPDLSGHAYVGRDIYKSRQSGSQVPDTPDWFVRNEDTVDSVGLGLRWAGEGRFEVGGDYVLSRSTGEVDIRSNNALPPVGQFPDIKANIHSLRLYADYKLEKNTKLKLQYRYEKLDADEWSIDGVNPDTIPEVLLLGEQNPSYSQHLFGVSLVVRF